MTSGGRGADRGKVLATLRGRLVMLVLAVLIPASVSSGVLLWSAYAQARTALERQIQDQARALGLVVDRQLGQNLVLVQALTAMPTFRQGDWQAFDTQARQALLGQEHWIAVVDAEGRQLVNTHLPPGVKLPGGNGGAGRLPTVSWGGLQPSGTRISNLFYGAAAAGPVVIASRPVRLQSGQVVSLAVTSRARSFDRLWREQRVPETWVGVVVDSRAVIVTRSRRADVYVGKPASASMRQMLLQRHEGVGETRTLDGVRSITAWSRSPRYGWSFILAAPRAEIVGEARASLLMAGLAGLLLMGAGVALAVWLARHISRPVEALRSAALEWERGREPAIIHSGVTEIDALSDALADSAARLAAKQLELQELNASLEQRVADRSRELEAATESLVQAQKLEAIGRLTGGVAHDFNNLLMAVSGNLDLLKRRLTDERLLTYVANARQASERGAKLTSQLLAFSRKQRLQPRALDVSQAIAEASTLLAGTLGGGVQIQTPEAQGTWPALADPTQLELVILNLVINARDAMPSGGVVTVGAENVVRTAPGARVEAPPAGEFVMIYVADTGSGMSPEVAERVFEPFFTTKAVGQGSGLGLPQVLGLAKQLGGGVEIDTAPGQGSTVRVFLPRAEIEASEPAAAAASPAPDMTAVRVLVLDDDVDVRGVAVAMLSDLGCHVSETASGEEALALLQTDAPFDVVLVDFAMPGMNGVEAAARMGQLRPGLPVVMMSGYAEAETLAARWTGRLLHKPFDAQALANELTAARG